MTEKANLISPFPDVPRQVWKENLLREVICQIRFPKLLVIDRDIPVEFQQSIYRRYPILEEKEGSTSKYRRVSHPLAPNR